MGSPDHRIAPIMMQSVFFLKAQTRKLNLPLKFFEVLVCLDYWEVNQSMEQAEFEAVCYLNTDNTCNEFYEHMEEIIAIHVPRRTRHRQSLPIERQMSKTSFPRSQFNLDQTNAPKQRDRRNQGSYNLGIIMANSQ